MVVEIQFLFIPRGLKESRGYEPTTRDHFSGHPVRGIKVAGAYRSSLITPRHDVHQPHGSAELVDGLKPPMAEDRNTFRQFPSHFIGKQKRRKRGTLFVSIVYHTTSFPCLASSNLRTNNVQHHGKETK